MKELKESDVVTAIITSFLRREKKSMKKLAVVLMHVKNVSRSSKVMTNFKVTSNKFIQITKLLVPSVI